MEWRNLVYPVISSAVAVIIVSLNEAEFRKRFYAAFVLMLIKNMIRVIIHSFKNFNTVPIKQHGIALLMRLYTKIERG